MVTSTPQRSDSSTQPADFTRPQEPQSPSNFNRTSKRQQRALNVNPPLRLDLGSGAHTSKTASTAISCQLDAIERKAKIHRTVMVDFASTVDKFVSSYKQSEQRSFAHDMCDRIISFLTTSLYVDSNDFVPIRIQSQTSRGSSTPASKSVSFAGMARTLKDSGADFHTAKAPSASSSGRAPTSSSGGVSLTLSEKGSTLKREDRRLLVPVEPSALLQRPEPFALRQELCARIPGLTLALIPTITPTRTGWAINPSDLTTRDLLTTQENTKTILQVLHGTAVKQPEVWYNYAVPGVPATMHQLIGGTIAITAKLVAEEVEAQTKQSPASCRPSRHGANPLTGKITWIASFLSPVRPFRLFNTSELSKAIDKKPAITRHDPGCQGFCNPAKCIRYARCNVCSTRLDQHEGPSGINCTGKARCANCHGPFPAGHDLCPAAPVRRNGKTFRLTKKEVDAIRRHGDRNFRDAHAAPAPATQLDSQLQPQAQGPKENATTGQSKRKRASAITADENAGSRSTAPPSQSSGPPSSSQPTSSRPRRSTVSGRNLNLVDLSAQSFAGSQGDMDIDTSEPSC
jgi:hypothetical protein